MLRHRLLVTLEVSRGLISCRRPFCMTPLTHWGRVTHICVSKLTIIGSYNGLSHGRRQAIIWTNAGLLLVGPLGRNFSENLIEILTFSFRKMRLKMSSGKWRSFCLSLNVLKLHMAYSQCNGICQANMSNPHWDCWWSARRVDWTWWLNQIKVFSALPALCEGNPLRFSLICAWTNGWAINRDAGK